jgi:hypothetical protein
MCVSVSQAVLLPGTQQLDRRGCRVAHLERTAGGVVRQNAVRAGTVDDLSLGLDPPRLGAPPPRSPPADALSAMRSRRHLVIENLALRQDDDTVVRGGVSRSVPAAVPGRLRPYWAASR